MTMTGNMARRGKGARGVLTALALVLAAGCGGDNAVAPKPDVPAIKIQNNSAQTITDIFYSDCASDSFGDDRLAGTIAPGASQTFTADVVVGCFDVLVRTSTGSTAAFSQQQVTGGTFTVNVGNF